MSRARTTQGPPLETRRVLLIVDDDPAILNTLSLALERTHTVHTPTSAREARDRLRELTPDLPILDINLGDEGGLNILAEFRQASAAPVLIITGHGSEAAAIRALHLRANAYLQKPFALSTLRTQVAELPAEGPRPEHLAERGRQVIETLVEQPVSAADVAERLGVNPRHLLTAFRARFGRTPMQHLREIRLQRAEHLLLTTTLLVSEVAVRAGFRDAAYFDRAFKRALGITPLEFRRTHVAQAPDPPDASQAEGTGSE